VDCSGDGDALLRVVLGVVVAVGVGAAAGDERTTSCEGTSGALASAGSTTATKTTAVSRTRPSGTVHHRRTPDAVPRRLDLTGSRYSPAP
jgi:hypothetical protein